MVEEAIAKAHADHPHKEAAPKTTEDEWKDLMKQPDPLEDQDIYAGEKVQECHENCAAPVDAEATEMEDDIGDVLTRSFNKEKKKSTFVQNIPQILTQKKAENYNKLFNGLSEHDIDSMEI